MFSLVLSPNSNAYGRNGTYRADSVAIEPSIDVADYVFFGIMGSKGAYNASVHLSKHDAAALGRALLEAAGHDPHESCGDYCSIACHPEPLTCQGCGMVDPCAYHYHYEDCTLIEPGDIPVARAANA